jgi:hypothetical protein
LIGPTTSANPLRGVRLKFTSDPSSHAFLANHGASTYKTVPALAAILKSLKCIKIQFNNKFVGIFFACGQFFPGHVHCVTKVEHEKPVQLCT